MQENEETKTLTKKNLQSTKPVEKNKKLR